VKRYAVLLAGLFVLLAAPTTALACTPPPGGLPTITITQQTNAAQLVAEGTVLSVQTDPTTYRDLAVIQVAQYLKGIGPELIAVGNYGSTSICLAPVSAGQTGIFFINGDEASGYQASYISQFDAVRPNTSANVQEALAASGQAARTDFTQPSAVATADTPTVAPLPSPTPFPPLPPLPLLTPTPAVGSELLLLGAGGGLGLLCGILIGLMLAFGYLAFRRRNE
jgi:hypothetical protein